jgi:hypothetical protein
MGFLDRLGAAEMTTSCPAYPRSHSNPFPLLLGIIAVVIMLASAHAVITHGQAAIDAQNCFNGGGTVMKQIKFDPITGRSMKFCNQSGNWYVSIDRCEGGNVTCFPRSAAKCLRDALDYARRSGFTQDILLH